MTTIDRHLRELIADPLFLKYHVETVKGKRFNPFDVLRYSDYEIRHSNVLAWLFQPNETHGIGDAFIRAFTTAMNEAARRQGTPPVLLPSSFDAKNVRVERELDYVDITLFFENESVLIAVENKMGEASPEHASQVIGYHKMLCEKHQGVYDDVHSVLLTTSPTADVPEHRFIHVSWNRVRDIVKSIHDHGRFESDEGDRIRAFLGHYLEIVERFIVHPETANDYFWSLLDDHRPLLERLLKNREEGVENIEEALSDDLGKYRGTVRRLVNDFRHEPGRLRLAVKSLLKRRGFRIWGPGGFLYFRNHDTDETRESLNLPWWQARWTMGFAPRWVNMSLEFPLTGKEAQATRPVVDRIARFLKDNPIDTSPEGRAKYPNNVRSGYLVAYAHPLMTDEELIATPAAEIEKVALGKMAAFLDQDFTRVEAYLKCLAFDPAVDGLH